MMTPDTSWTTSRTGLISLTVWPSRRTTPCNQSDARIAHANKKTSAIAANMPGPVFLLDMGDNVGGGSPGDGTLLL